MTHQYTNQELKILLSTLWDKYGSDLPSYNDTKSKLSEMFKNADGIRLHKKMTKTMKYLSQPYSRPPFTADYETKLFKALREAMFHMPFNRVPLHLNDDGITGEVIKWRLKIGH